MGKQISNSSILLTSAIPLDARSHFITYQEAAAAVADKQGISVVRSSNDATVTSGIYQNYYYGQIITTEQHGTFTVVASSDYSACKKELEDEWSDNVTYKYDGTAKQLTITTTAGTYLKAHTDVITEVASNSTIFLTDKILPFYSFYGTTTPVIKVTLGIGTTVVNKLAENFIDGSFEFSSHLQPLSGSGGGGGGSSIAGAKTTDETILGIVDNYIQIGNLAAKDTIKLEDVDKTDTLYNLVNRAMNASQFELDEENNTWSLKYIYGGTATDTD